MAPKLHESNVKECAQGNREWLDKAMQLLFAMALAIYFGSINPKLHDNDFLVNRPCLRTAENMF
jgi:hypothetical protein